jgi:hypothetical protein
MRFPSAVRPSSLSAGTSVNSGLRSGGGAGRKVPYQADPHRDPIRGRRLADITMRVLADKMTERLSQRVVIENRPGPAASWRPRP